MAFTLITGKAFVEDRPKTASTAFAKGVAVTTTSGYLAVAGSSTAKIAGIANREISSTSKKIDGVTADYATTSDLQITVPTSESRFIADVTGGTIAQANVGTQYDTASDGLSVLVSGTTYKNWTLKGVITSTKGIFACATPEDLK